MKSQEFTMDQEGPPEELPHPIGISYVFMREGHEWHSCEVIVTKDRGDHYMIARCCDVAEGLLAPRHSPKRTVNTWPCTEKELW